MDTPLAAALRTATRTEHEQAEHMPFVGELMAGRLPLAAYVDLLSQHHAIYHALEAAEPFVRADCAGASVVVDGLARSGSIESDLAVLCGPTWRDGLRVLPATRRYVDRLRATAQTWVGGYVAHAYTRYLGDLSGGQAIRTVLRRTMAVPDDALAFYTFASIPKPKLFKDAYRARLDALPFGVDERARVIDEARVAFRLNADVFADLGAVHLPAVRREPATDVA
ncbi:biliverdin-producing heme oxygenase [Cellulomonas aerilata]|uniref:Biliverdin-producing heme oxygenase n=1 Tax=Cellulomonas aerilata TaxID=515326 RepID=A0A512DG69_9CELL|nr:biliverdin-producing heme oxygenase [Cellulomonas aerilata]GEO35483.1 biliverdin-producing heme oxygenase [Cellulomonas aerilata]